MFLDSRIYAVKRDAHIVRGEYMRLQKDLSIRKAISSGFLVNFIDAKRR